MEEMFDTLGSLRGAAYAVEENGRYRGVFIVDQANLERELPESLPGPGKKVVFVGYGHDQNGNVLSLQVRIDRVEAGFFLFEEDVGN